MSYTFLLYCVYIKETGKLEGGLKPECFFFQVDVLISGGGGGGREKLLSKGGYNWHFTVYTVPMRTLSYGPVTLHTNTTFYRDT